MKHTVTDDPHPAFDPPMIDWLIELWFYVPLDTKYVIGMEKLNPTQHRHALTNQKKCTIHLPHMTQP